jgi:hypothetical protein
MNPNQQAVNVPQMSTTVSTVVQDLVLAAKAVSAAQGPNEITVVQLLVKPVADLTMEVSRHPAYYEADLLTPLVTAVQDLVVVLPTTGPLGTCRGTFEQLLTTLGRAWHCWQAAMNGVSATLLPDRAGWFNTHLPNPAKLELTLVLQQTGANFPELLERYAKRTANPSGPGTPGNLATQVAAAIGTVPALAEILSGSATASLLGGCITVLDEQTFNATYVSIFKERGQSTFGTIKGVDWACVALAQVDTVYGCHHNGSVYLRNNDAQLSDCVHEVMHLLSWLRTKSAWLTAFGRLLEEAAAEVTSHIVCDAAGIPQRPEIYSAHVTILKMIMEHGGLSQLDLLKAYFNGDVEPVRTAILKVAGQTGLQILLAYKGGDILETTRPWIAAFKEQQQKNSENCFVQ